MKRFQTNLVEQDARGAAAAIGNFDGVHLGHMAICNEVKKIAKEINVTFEFNHKPYNR